MQNPVAAQDTEPSEALWPRSAFRGRRTVVAGFYKMTATFYRNGAWHTQVAVFKPWCSTCTVPIWIGPNAWPYL
jgi:hypothetical protein